MKLTPRQLVVRGRGMAALLLHAIERERLVARFIDTYAVEFERPVCTAYAGQYRESLTNIRREGLLAMTMWMENELPKFLQPPRHAKSTRRLKLKGPRGRHALKKSAKSSDRKPAATDEIDPLLLFHAEFMSALSQALGWHPSELQEFRRDLRLYRQLAVGKKPARISRQLSARVEGPFVDRCGVLLDPSMLDKARLAAARFQNQLHITTQAALRKLFSRRREN
jgi:hypothetical protein